MGAGGTGPRFKNVVCPLFLEARTFTQPSSSPKGKAVYDLAPKSTQGDVLLYVFDPAGSDRRGKVVIELDFGSKTGPQRTRITTNAVRTAGYVEPENLRNPRYAVLDGGVEDE